VLSNIEGEKKGSGMIGTYRKGEKRERSSLALCRGKAPITSFCRVRGKGVALSLPSVRRRR